MKRADPRCTRSRTRHRPSSAARERHTFRVQEYTKRVYSVYKVCKYLSTPCQLNSAHGSRSNQPGYILPTAELQSNIRHNSLISLRRTWKPAAMRATPMRVMVTPAAEPECVRFSGVACSRGLLKTTWKLHKRHSYSRATTEQNGLGLGGLQNAVKTHR